MRFSICDEISFTSACPLTHGLMNGMMTDNPHEVQDFTKLINMRHEGNSLGGLSNAQEVAAAMGGKMRDLGISGGIA